MPKITPCSRTELVRKLKTLGFDGPFSGGKHNYMQKGSYRQTIPNPHGQSISPILIKEILKQAVISIDEWLNA